jgi:hypothetical protein
MEAAAMSTVALDRERLAKLLGMLGSDHDGEVANAGRAADALVRRAGVTWPEVVTPSLPRQSRERELESINDALDLCIEFATALTEWEVHFCWSLYRRKNPLTEKQKAVLVRLVAKAQAAARGAP